MHRAEASTPAPTYGTSRHSSSPWTVPSSPKGPCRTGKTTSAPSRALVAAPTAWPLTFGTGVVWGFGALVATTIVTVDPCGTWVPPLGLWLITLPGLTVEELCLLTWAVKPAP